MKKFTLFNYWTGLLNCVIGDVMLSNTKIMLINHKQQDFKSKFGLLIEIWQMWMSAQAMNITATSRVSAQTTLVHFLVNVWKDTQEMGLGVQVSFTSRPHIFVLV